MIVRNLICAAFVLLAVFAYNSADADQPRNAPFFEIPSPDSVQIITVSDGSVIIGRITRSTENEVEFTTEMGKITIPKAKIREIKTVPSSSVSGGSYRFPDPNVSRLYFAPTGRMLPRGKGYIADYYLFFPAFNYGVTDRMSLGGGFSILPTGRMSDQIYYLTPKFGIKRSQKINISVGALVIKFPHIEDQNSPFVSVLYGVGTWGTTERNVTAAFGYGLVDGKFADRPLIVLGGEQRLTRRLAFITENWMIPGIDNVLISYGLRFLTEKFTTDFAFLNTVGKEALFPGIPYIDFVFNF